MDLIDDYSAPDKQQHAAVGFVIGAASAALVDRLWPDMHPAAKVVVATIPAALVGVAKEISDAQHQDRHSVDARDAIATAGGGALGAISVTLVLRF